MRATSPAELHFDSHAISDVNSLLFAEFSAGKRSSFEELHRNLDVPLVNFARRLTGNHHRAEDVAQSTWIKAIVKAESFDPHVLFRNWLFGIARHEALNSFRQERKLITQTALTPEVSDGGLPSDPLDLLVATAKPTKPPADCLIHQEEMSEKERALLKMHKARKGLNKRDALYIRGHFLQEKPLNEIDPTATPGASKYRMREALRHLRKLFEHDQDKAKEEQAKHREAKREMLLRINEQAAKMPEEVRLTLVHVLVHSRTLAQAAKEIGIAKSTAHKYLNQGLDLLNFSA